MSSVDLLVSVSYSRDLEIWKLTHPHILRHINAAQYQLLVPKDEVDVFRAQTSSRFDVLAQEDFLGRHSRSSIADALPDQFKRRAGWYMQQFAKLNALRQGRTDDVNVIWDADAMPLKPICYMLQRQLTFFRGTGIHRPYYATIENLLAMKCSSPFSFMAMTMPARRSWIDELCREIETRAGQDWIGAVMRALPQRDQSEFSEYETLGTYVANRFPNDWTFSRGAWEHNGYSVVGDPAEAREADLAHAAKLWEFIVFEKYYDGCTAPPQRLSDRLRVSLRKLARQLGLRSLAIRLRNSAF